MSVYWKKSRCYRKNYMAPELLIMTMKCRRFRFESLIYAVITGVATLFIAKLSIIYVTHVDNVVVSALAWALTSGFAMATLAWIVDAVRPGLLRAWTNRSIPKSMPREERRAVLTKRDIRRVSRLMKRA